MIGVLRFRFLALAPVASHTLFESINSGVLVLDLQSRVLDANPVARRFLGMGPSEIGKRLDALSSPTALRLAAIIESKPSNELFADYPASGVWMNVVTSPLRHRNRDAGRLILLQDITERKRLEKEREEMILTLRDALSQIKTLEGLIPICAHCKKIRNDLGYWEQLEKYIAERSEAVFSHGICPDCMETHYGWLKKSDPHPEQNG
jgi:PAS domain S-box-containing protein